MSDYEWYHCDCGRTHDVGVVCAIGRRQNKLAETKGSDLTAEESRWLKRLKKIMSETPKDLLLYNIDWGITICKRGVSSNEFSTTVECPLTSGTMLTDIHDDNPENGPTNK